MDRTSAGLTDVKEETLEQAADLLMLRRDTFRIIDGAGPSVDDQDTSSERSAQADLIDEEKARAANRPRKRAYLPDGNGERTSATCHTAEMHLPWGSSH